MSEIHWHPPPDSLALSHQQVHLWHVDLETFIEHQQHVHLYPLLSDDEQQRANRFYFERDRHRFIVGRGLLRTILSHYLTLAPNQIQFDYGPQGKPQLHSQSTGQNSDVPALTFNLSHSQGLALYAMTCDRPIGVDLEQIRSIDALELAQRFFAPSEYEAIAALSPDQQERIFFEFWTCKEAYLKAIGKGLGGLNQVEIAFGEDRAVTLVGQSNPSHPYHHWSLQQLIPTSDYVAALAVMGPAQLSYFRYDVERLRSRIKNRLIG